MTGAVRLSTVSRIMQVTLVTSGLMLASSAAFAASCGSLTNFHRPNTTITTAQIVPAGTFVTPTNQQIAGLPEFCRVGGGSPFVSGLLERFSVGRSPFLRCEVGQKSACFISVDSL
jgi:hypothetical protein